MLVHMMCVDTKRFMGWWFSLEKNGVVMFNALNELDKVRFQTFLGCYKSSCWNINEYACLLKLDVIEFKCLFTDRPGWKDEGMRKRFIALVLIKRWVKEWTGGFRCSAAVWSLWVESGWLKICKILRWKVEEIEVGLVWGAWIESKGRPIREPWSWKVWRWSAQLESGGGS